MKRKKPTHSIKFMAFLVLSSIGMIISGLLISNLTNKKTSFDSRSQAQGIQNPTLSVTHSPSTPTTNQPLTLSFQINTGSFETSGVQIKNLSITDGTASTFPASLTNVANLQVFQNTISGNTVQYIGALKDITVPYDTNGQVTTLATLTFTPKNPGDIILTFDPSQSIVAQYNGAGTNILTPPSNHTITVGQAIQCTQNEDVCDPDSCDFDQPTCDEKDTGDSENGDDDDNSNNDADSNVGGPQSSCSVPYAPAKIVAKTGIKSGEIIVRWVRPGDHKYFGISFGRESGKYQWGNTNVGNTRDFTIRYLDPGSRYYVVITAINDCGAGAYSQEVSAIARANPTTPVVKTTPQTPLPQPQIISNLPTPTPSPIPAVIVEDEPPTKSSLLDKFFDSKFFYLTIGILVAMVIQGALIKHHPPLPPRHKLTPKPKAPPTNKPSSPASHVAKTSPKSAPHPKPKNSI